MTVHEQHPLRQLGHTVGGGIYDQRRRHADGARTASSPATRPTGGGGGIYANSGTLTVSNSTLSGNSSGGGIRLEHGGATALSGNRPSAAASQHSLTVTNSTLSGNSASTRRRHSDNLGTLTVQNSTLSGNSAPTAAASTSGFLAR